LSAAPDPAGGGYSAPSDPLATFKGPTSKGSEGKEMEGGEEMEGEAKGPTSKERGRGRG